MILDQIIATLTPYMLLICLTGVTLGILWGAMPGLSTTMAMVLDRISASELSSTTPVDGIGADDIERIVSQQAVSEEATMDGEIEAGLKAIERELTGGEN